MKRNIQHLEGTLFYWIRRTTHGVILLLFISISFDPGTLEELELDGNHNLFIVYLDKTGGFLSPSAFLLPVNHIQSSPRANACALLALLPLNYHPSIHSWRARSVTLYLWLLHKQMSLKMFQPQGWGVGGCSVTPRWFHTRYLSCRMSCEKAKLVQNGFLRKQRHKFSCGRNTSLLGKNLFWTKLNQRDRRKGKREALTHRYSSVKWKPSTECVQ